MYQHDSLIGVSWHQCDSREEEVCSHSMRYYENIEVVSEYLGLTIYIETVSEKQGDNINMTIVRGHMESRPTVLDEVRKNIDIFTRSVM